MKNRKKMHKRSIPLCVTFATATLLFTGCNLAPDMKTPDENLPAALGSISEASVVNNPALDQWWLRFNDPTLNRLVDDALALHPGVMQSLAAVQQARAALGMANADRWPALTANAQAARKESPAFQLAPGQTDPANAFQINALLSYEIDLFGKVANASRAARAELAASEFALHGTRSTLAAETVSLYFNLVATREQLNLTEKAIETRRHTVRIREKRFEAGYGSDAERQQALADLASTEATLPDIKQAVEQLQTALRVLTGADPASIWQSAPIDGIPTTLPEPPEAHWNYLPASILERRPDILAASARLEAANARVGIARAQRWPSLSISAILGTADSETDGLFTEASRTWTLAGNLAGPIYDFGKTRNRVRSAEAQLEMAEWNYRSIVRQAFRELKDSVTRVNFSNESVQSRAKQEQAWRRYLDISINRDESGYSDPIELLDAQRGHFAAELALVTARLNRLTATVDLFRALGGGWDPNPASTEPAE